MLRKSSAGIYQSTLLLSIPGLTHGFSSRQFGDMRLENKRHIFLKCLNLKSELVYTQQVHGTQVHIVNADSSHKQLVIHADGLVSKSLKGHHAVLGVYTADCVPILAVAPKTGIYGIAHAGWRGTLGKIANRLIKTMKQLGANPREIYVSLGPHIGGCCYTVNQRRAHHFRQALGNHTACLRARHWYVDLGLANYQQLIVLGILNSQIDVESPCTACNQDEFFSYRKNFGKNFGEMLGVITYAD